MEIELECELGTATRRSERSACEEMERGAWGCRRRRRRRIPETKWRISGGRQRQSGEMIDGQLGRRVAHDAVYCLSEVTWDLGFDRYFNLLQVVEKTGVPNYCSTKTQM